jgi:hypothetical protein
MTDHINGDPSDNRWANLREANHFQNQYNRGPQKTNTTGIKGASIRKNGKAVAMIRAEGKRIYLGIFDNAVIAGQAYQEASLKYHGEFRKS